MLKLLPIPIFIFLVILFSPAISKVDAVELFSSPISPIDEQMYLQVEKYKYYIPLLVSYQ